VSNTSRVLSPSSRSSAFTSQACSILAPPLGFCLQRFVRVLSRTPFGLPCPAFPWPTSGPFGPSGWIVVALWWIALRNHTFYSFAGCRVCVRPVTLPPLRCHLQPCFHTLGFQDSSPEHVRFPGAAFNRLPDSHLSWPLALQGLTVLTWGLDSASPPLSLLLVPRRPLLEPQGLDRSSLRQGATFSRSLGPHRCLTLLSFPPSYLDLLLRTWPPAGSLFHLGARSALPPRHPLLFAGFSRPA
jgi:hypothetical protein